MRELSGNLRIAHGLNRTTIGAVILLVVIMIVFYVVYARQISSNEAIICDFDKPVHDASLIQTNGTPPPQQIAPIQAFDYAVANTLLNYVESTYNADTINVKNLANLIRVMTRIRLDLQSWVSTGKHQNSSLSEAHSKFVARLQKIEVNFYPFLSGKHKTADEWQASYSGRGIVISGKSSHMRYVVYLVKNLKTISCNLPVEFVTEAAYEVSAENKALLNSLGVKLIYLNETIDNNKAQLGSYGMKLAAMFVSSFRETVMVDCDDVFLRDPELLFDDPGYKATGTLFFYEQPERFNSFGCRDWLRDNLPQPLSQRVLSSNFFKGHAREIDSSVVVMDKARCFYGLLASTRINVHREREILYPVLGGDAELWWIGFEMAGVLYSISPFTAYSIGPKNGNEVCGKNMHVGNDGRPFFWNQGFVRTKGENNNDLLNFEAYAPDGIVVVFSKFLYCVKGIGAIPLNEQEFKLAGKLKQIWINTTGFSNWK